jgi:hypothetical protein
VRVIPRLRAIGSFVRENRKTITVWIAIATVVVLLAFGPHWLWQLRDAKRLGVVIVDKTVPFENYREHEDFDWLLHAWKVTGVSGRFLDPAQDYIGFDPIQKRGHDLEPKHLTQADVLFIADTYGVYVGDYQRPGKVAALERSRKIYGGITDEEARAIADFAGRGGLVIGEFNSFASPTEGEGQRTMEALFGVRWTHWVARYWPDVQDPSEVPTWIGSVYERVFKRAFDIHGAALIFVKDDMDMIVLEPGKHLAPGVITMHRTEAAPEVGDLPEAGSYGYWLDVIEAKDADVLYDYRIETTALGAQEIAAHGLPGSFPALTRRKGKTAAWYFAGDFVDNASDKGDPERWGLLGWRRYTSGILGSPLEAAFLWAWYAPVIESIVLPRARASSP